MIDSRECDDFVMLLALERKYKMLSQKIAWATREGNTCDVEKAKLTCCLTALGNLKERMWKELSE